jgi:hypothetical protein
MTEAISTSETSVKFYETTRCNIQEDFFLWGYIKDLVYQMKVKDVAKLCCQINAACETVTPMMLQNIWQEVEYHLNICWATKGAHMEIYWGAPKVRESLHPSVKFSCVLQHQDGVHIEIYWGAPKDSESLHPSVKFPHVLQRQDVIHMEIYWEAPKVSESRHPSVKFPCVYQSLGYISFCYW